MLRKLRSLLPFILATLGFTLAALATAMPLFEWQISEIVTNLPPEVHINPSPWVTKSGESLDDASYIFYQIRVLKNRISCRPDKLNYTVMRSRNDQALEQLALDVNQKVLSWLSVWDMIGLVLLLCGLYIWWFEIWYKRPISEAVILTAIAMMFYYVLMQILRSLLAKVGLGPGCSEIMEVSVPYYGTLTFSARLSRVHYKTLFVLFVGVLSELGALYMMLRQIVRAVRERKKS